MGIVETDSSKTIQIKTINSASEDMNNKFFSNDFIDEIKASESGFDFSPYEISFLALPETNAYGQPYMELSPAAQDYFDNLDRLCHDNPQAALKFLIILACYNKAYFYTEKIKDIIIQKLYSCFIEDSLTCKDRLELGIQCWLYWPEQHGRFTKDIFIEPLIKLFVQEASVDPAYILAKFDLVEERGSRSDYIFSSTEGHQDEFLEFARKLEQHRPELLIFALQRCLEDAHKEYGSYANYCPMEGHLRLVAKELFDILQDKKYVSIVDYQSVYRVLILYAYPYEYWFSELFQIFWTVETSKVIADDQSPMNCFLIAQNLSSEHPLQEVVRTHFREWALNFQCLDTEKPNALVDRADRLIYLINTACSEKSSYIRNRSFSSLEECVLVTDALDAYWQMVNWLQTHHPKMCFYVLNQGLEMDSSTVQQTRNLGELSKIKFIEMFELFCQEHTNEAAEIVEYMVKRSHYSFIDVHLYQMLDKIYPLLLAHNPQLAQQALKSGSSGIGYEIEYWYPGRKCSRRY